ncbi:YceI family protein [Roseivirga pacifica]|uniref:YceI family protein n=1 Tax=Roseivirga pacifica TaxID=1267423 RepID=UPI003BAFA20A
MKILKSTLALTLLAAVVLSCGSNGKTVETSDAKAVKANAEATAIPVATTESIVTWIGSKPAGKHNGTIGITEGNVLVDGNKVVGGTFTIDINSLTVVDLPADSEWNAKLKGHLLDDDFFDAANHPTATFEITEVSPFAQAELTADKAEFESEFTPASLSEVMVENPTHFVSGNLTMRGTTKNITFPASVSIENGQVKAVANFNIDRTDWKLMYGDEASVADKAKDEFVYNTVNVGFELKAGTGAAL